MHLLTLHRAEQCGLAESRSGSWARKIPTSHQPHGTDRIEMHRWLSTLLKEQDTFKLEERVLCCILHCLWKEDELRHDILEDADVRKKAFNMFLMEALDVYQASRNSGGHNSRLSQHIVDVLPMGPDKSMEGDPTAPADVGSPAGGGAATGGAAEPPAPADAAPSDEAAPAPAAPPQTEIRHMAAKRQRPEDADDATDVCSELTVAKISGRNITKREKATWKSLSQQLPEEHIVLPTASLLFIRCVRCPELVFTEYAAMQDHWEERRHCLCCVMCDALMAPASMALGHLRLAHQHAVPDNWFVFVACLPCRWSDFGSTEDVISHMASHRAARALQPAVYPPHLTCFKRVVCNQCGRVLVDSRSEAVDRYLRRPGTPCQHEQAPTVACATCRLVWAGAAALAAHLRLDRGSCYHLRTKAPAGGCPLCRRAMQPGESLPDHLLGHAAAGLRCVQCGLVTDTHTEMAAHRQFLWRCSCAACDTSVGRGSRLLRHVLEDHDGGRMLTETRRARPQRNAPEQGMCAICGRHQTRLLDHMRLIHRRRHCQCCGRDVSVATWLSHRRRREQPERLFCDQCDTMFSTPSALRVHMRQHSGERPFQCDACQIGFARKKQLVTHVHRKHHNGGT
ncbi:zinc finger protein 26-like isoform X1 [Pollicipes pollicipes]|uniref:zinc finger protein 26-like isoform X1 n=2 Tax=Pollicipes pollicipes TaxID=41117 RepID=UPI0018854EEB|nr:zinc finger protein 26-like isoform X1 [Pollicipes pollicipes]